MSLTSIVSGASESPVGACLSSESTTVPSIESTPCPTPLASPAKRKARKRPQKKQSERSFKPVSSLKSLRSKESSEDSNSPDTSSPTDTVVSQEGSVVSAELHT